VFSPLSLLASISVVLEASPPRKFPSLTLLQHEDCPSFFRSFLVIVGPSSWRLAYLSRA